MDASKPPRNSPVRKNRPAPRRRRAGPAQPLARGPIVAAALALVDRDGLAGLSMRRLGAALGVDPMAVYYHVSGKEALLDAIVEAVMATIDLSVIHPEDPPEQRIMCAAIAYRDAMLAHLHAVPILLQRRPATAAALHPVERLVSVLREAGLPPDQAMAGMNAIAAAVRGVVGMAAAAQHPKAKQFEAAQLSAEAFPCLLEAAQSEGDFFERDFEFGIRALARGLLLAAQAGS